MKYFVLPKSTCVHSQPNCRRSRVQGASEVVWNDSFRLCKHCEWKNVYECMICMDQKNTNDCNCVHEHHICTTCMQAYISTLSTNPRWNYKLLCPCGESQRIMKSIPQTIKHLIERIKKQKRTSATNTYAQCHVDAALEQIVNLKCKSCDSAFIDFSGCLAIQCRCDKHFCGLCLQIFTNSKACHSHVLDCKWNVDEYFRHREDYYMTNSQWKRLQHTRIAWNLWKYAWTVYSETKSFLFTIGIMARLSSHVSILPWCISDSFTMTCSILWSTETFALFTIVVLLFKRPMFTLAWFLLGMQQLASLVSYATYYCRHGYKAFFASNKVPTL